MVLKRGSNQACLEQACKRQLPERNVEIYCDTAAELSVYAEERKLRGAEIPDQELEERRREVCAEGQTARLRCRRPWLLSTYRKKEHPLDAVHETIQGSRREAAGTGAPVAEVARACEVNPNVLHRGKRELHDYGVKAFAGNGRPRAEEERVAALERKVGRQALEIDFLQRCLQHVEHDPFCNPTGTINSQRVVSSVLTDCLSPGIHPVAALPVADTQKPNGGGMGQLSRPQPLTGECLLVWE